MYLFLIATFINALSFAIEFWLLHRNQTRIYQVKAHLMPVLLYLQNQRLKIKVNWENIEETLGTHFFQINPFISYGADTIKQTCSSSKLFFFCKPPITSCLKNQVLWKPKNIYVFRSYLIYNSIWFNSYCSRKCKQEPSCIWTLHEQLAGTSARFPFKDNLRSDSAVPTAVPGSYSCQ